MSWPTSCKSLIVALLLVGVPAIGFTQEQVSNLENELMARERAEQEAKSSKIIFNGMLYMMGWVGKETNYAYIYDNDSYLGLGYRFSSHSKVYLDIKLADILKPSNAWADSEMYGEVDFLGEAGIEGYGLTLKLGKFNQKNRYFGEYAMGIGKDFIADKRANLDMMNWKLTFNVNSPKLPLELSFMSDLDFGQRPAPNVPLVNDWNNKGLSLIGDASITSLPLSEMIFLSLDLFYNDQFYVNEQSWDYTGINGNYLDLNNRTTYIGSSARLFFDTDLPINFSLGSSVKYFDIKKDGYFTTIDQNGDESIEMTTSRSKGTDFDVGLWLGNYTFMDGRIAYQRIDEGQSLQQHTMGIETNLYMIPKVTIYGGVAIAFEKELVNFGAALDEGKARYGWDIGIIYEPVTGVLLTTGWQKMVRWDDMGYFYIKATYWW